MFLYGIKPDTKMQLLDVLDYKKGKLLVRYLGVPLISTKLTSPNCLIFVDHIMAKAKSE
jgi:Zn/Cd-binding protein ZinT